jgi:hypothetical protein
MGMKHAHILICLLCIYHSPLQANDAAAVHILSDQWIVVVTDPTDAIIQQLDTWHHGKYQKAIDNWNAGQPAGNKPHWGAWTFIKQTRARDYARARVAIGERQMLDPSTYTISSSQDPNYITPQTITHGTSALVGVDGQLNVGAGITRYGIYAYLKLAKPLQNNATYTVQWHGQRSTTFTHVADHSISRLIKINQIGYLPNEKKYAYVGGWLPHIGGFDLSTYQTIELRNEHDNSTVWSGKLSLRDEASRHDPTRNEPDPLKRPYITGENVYSCDFSDFSTPGEYHLFIPGLGRSWPFSIGSDVYAEAFYTSIRGLFHQRGSFALTQPYTAWERPQLHTAPVYESDHLPFSFGPIKPPKGYERFDVIGGTTNRRHVTHNLVGGWYDAADYDRNCSHYTNIFDLLWLNELRPGMFTDNQLNIPESGNGIPDILDEVEFGLRVWLRSQRIDGSVSGMVETNTHPPFDDQKHLWAFSKRTRWSSLLFAAAAAQYARNVRDYAPELASRYLRASIKAYEFGSDPANSLGSVAISGRRKRGAGNHYVTRFTETDAHYLPYLLLAETQLFLTTNNKKFHSDWDKLVTKCPPPYAWPFTIKDYSPWIYYPLVTSLADHCSEEIRETISAWLTQQATQLSALTEHMPYRRTWPKQQDYWMSWGASLHTNHNRALWIEHSLNPARQLTDAISANHAFSFGANPLGMSWTTGIGSVYPAVLQHEWSERDGIADPMPGITLYGINEGIYRALKSEVWQQDGHNSTGRQETFTFWEPKDLPVWRRWSAHPHENVTQCEFTINETMSATAFSLGMLVPPNWQPSEQLKDRQPRKMDDLHGYWYLP